MQPNQMQQTQPELSPTARATPSRRQSLLLAVGAAGIVLVLGSAGIFGWQKLSEKSAKATIAPAVATTTSRPQLPGPLDGLNPLSCSDSGKPPIKLKGHALPICPPGSQSGATQAATPAAR